MGYGKRIREGNWASYQPERGLGPRETGTSGSRRDRPGAASRSEVRWLELRCGRTVPALGQVTVSP